MKKIHRQKTLADVVKEVEAKDIIIPVAVDGVRDNEYFKALSSRLPDLGQKFEELYSGQTFVPGRVYIVPVSNDYRVILFTVKLIEKYGAALIDIIDCWDNLVKLKDQFHINKVVTPVFDYKTTKLLDNLAIAPMIDHIWKTDLEVHIVDEADKLKFLVEGIEESQAGPIISWKQNPLKEVKFFNKDDILLLLVVHDMFTKAPKYRLAKSALIRLYKTFKDNGYFSELSFYKTEYGEYFREFMMKMNFMVNHGLLHNLMRGIEPGKCALCLGHNLFNFIWMSDDIAKTLQKDRDKMFNIVSKLHLGSLQRQKKFQDQKGGGGGNWKHKQKPQASGPAENPFSGF